MGRSTPQIEFKWPAWFRALRPPAPPKTKPVREDGGLTAWCAEAAASLALPELARKVRVSWNPRMQTTAGRAWWPDRSIELNPKLRDCEPDELWRTLKHELAHLVAYERGRRRRHIEPHGPEWQTACADLGIPGEQPFHTLPFKRRRMKRNHAYICPNCFATIHRVKPIQRSVACYDCCRKHNHGSYHDRYRLIKTTPGAPKITG
jgi:predicted SprT family Zn-dependent metalloprotease